MQQRVFLTVRLLVAGLLLELILDVVNGLTYQPVVFSRPQLSCRWHLIRIQ